MGDDRSPVVDRLTGTMIMSQSVSSDRVTVMGTPSHYSGLECVKFITVGLLVRVNSFYPLM
jgi:hypothetical protein